MTTDTFRRVALDPGLSVLPAKMDTPEARVLVTATCVQESALEYRFQVRGPARGFAQFERGGVVGVLTHPASRDYAIAACYALHVKATSPDVHFALALNDALCIAFARLLLWTLPLPLPEIGDVAGAWSQYLECWRPGRPRPEKWDASYARATEVLS